MIDLKRDPKGSMAYWNTWTDFWACADFRVEGFFE